MNKEKLYFVTLIIFGVMYGFSLGRFLDTFTFGWFWMGGLTLGILILSSFWGATLATDAKGRKDE